MVVVVVVTFEVEVEDVVVVVVAIVVIVVGAFEVVAVVVVNTVELNGIVTKDDNADDFDVVKVVFNVVKTEVDVAVVILMTVDGAVDPKY